MSARLHILGCTAPTLVDRTIKPPAKTVWICEEECPSDRCRSSIADGDKLQPTVAQAFCQSRHTSGTKCFLDARTWASENATRACILTNFGRAQMPDRID
jgi:hypothetical protein